MKTTQVAINRWMDRDAYIYTYIYYLAIKKMKSCHLWQHGWTLRVLCSVKYVRGRKINTIRFHLCVEYNKQINEQTKQNKNTQIQRPDWWLPDWSRGQLYGDGWNLDFGWWACSSVYRRPIRMLAREMPACCKPMLPLFNKQTKKQQQPYRMKEREGSNLKIPFYNYGRVSMYQDRISTIVGCFFFFFK